jgi:hypothetical protein
MAADKTDTRDVDVVIVTAIRLELDAVRQAY